MNNSAMPSNPLGFTAQCVARYPDPVLLKKATPVANHQWFASVDGILTHTDSVLTGISELAESMTWLMNELNAIGIAAPQVFQSTRLIVVRKRWSYSPFSTPDKVVLHPATWNNVVVMCDPEITYLGAPICSFEGCLSLPGQQGYTVVRSKKIGVMCSELVVDNNTFRLDKPRYQEYSDSMAIAIQHEVDHLDGILINAKGVRPHEEKAT